MKTVLITGSNGLIGSESVAFFCDRGFNAVGLDNDMRKTFFGEEASTEWNRHRLLKKYPQTYTHYDIDIRNNEAVKQIFTKHGMDIDLIIHAAAQPSHDWAASDPFTDFTVNANGTLVMLENTRLFCPEATFIFCSTNKVYGDRPNSLPLVEQATRRRRYPVITISCGSEARFLRSKRARAPQPRASPSHRGNVWEPKRCRLRTS